MEAAGKTEIAGKAFDFSRLRGTELLGALSSVVLIASMFLKWYTVSTPAGVQRDDDQWVCGVGDVSCTAWETFTILDLMTVVAALAPLVLAWIVVRGHKLSWPPGELTAVFGIAGIIIVGYNGILDKPGPQDSFGVGLGIGYWLAFASAIAMAAAGALRATETAGTRKAQGSF